MYLKTKQSGDLVRPTPLRSYNNAICLTDGSAATINKRKPLIEINYKNRICGEDTKNNTPKRNWKR